MKTSCGCAGARLSTSSIDPGESAEVSVEVTITTAGAKRETIWLLCRDKEPEVLTVSAVGEFAEALFATRDRLRLDEQGKASFVLIAYADTTDEPPVNFTAVSASEVTVAFEGWRMIQPPAPAEHRPGRWHGRVSISALMEPGHFVSTEIKLGAQTVSVWLEAQPTP